jgi:thioredoxin 1
MILKEVDILSFDAEVLEASKNGAPVMVFFDFNTAWSNSCRAIRPIVRELAEEMQGTIKVVTINVDSADNHLSRNFGVFAFPAFMLFKDGAFVPESEGSSRPKILTGSVSKDQLTDWLIKIPEIRDMPTCRRGRGYVASTDKFADDLH